MSATDDVATGAGPRDPRALLVANERIKLTAASVNGLAIAVFAVGGLAPFIAALGIVTERQGLSIGGALLLAVCFVVSGTLHLVGRWQIGRLDA